MHGALTRSAPETVAPAPRATSLLRFFTCGSVDDGKSTLIGRLLYDTGSVFEDQIEALERDSKKFGTQGEQLDFALLLDGLSAEREQGITIDVAYRYFSSKSRAFIVADTPGHEQYTRNMATGASTAELAIILIDARKGVLAQTRRHSYIVSMLGVRDIVLAVNKMDLVGFDRATFERIVAEYGEAAAALGFGSIVAIPMSARDGDNVTSRSAQTSWYGGPTLLEHLERVAPRIVDRDRAAFAMPVQWVNRPNLDFRGYAGTIAAGSLRPGDAVVALPGARASRVARIVTANGDLDEARAGHAVTVTLDDEIDVSRGDVLAAVSHRLSPRRSLVARVLWMIDDPLSAGRDYLIRQATASANVRVTAVHHAIDVESFAERPCAALAMNEIGLVSLASDKALIVSTEPDDRDFGVFILIDRLTDQTAGLGVIDVAAMAARAAPSGAAPAAPVTLADRLRAEAGAPGSSERAAFLRMTVEEGAIAFGLGAIAGVLAGDVSAGVAVAALGLVARAALQIWRLARAAAAADVNESGGGI